MIKIQENNTKKCPGETSLFVSFNYNPELVSIVKQVDGSVYDKKTTTWEVPISELSKLLNQFNSYDDIELELLKEKSDNLEDIKLPKFKTSPFPYQLDGIRYGLQKGHEQWLLTDAPGLGKSLQILYIAQELKKQKKIEHCLIICGINTLKTNWKKEVEKHTNLSCRILGERVNKKGIINYAGVKERLEDLNSRLSEFFIITNIETLRNNDIIKAINSGKNNFDMIVLDEAHCCFTYDTLIETDKGKLKIGDIVENKLSCNVYSFDFLTNSVVLQPISNFFKIMNHNELLELTIEVNGYFTSIRCTPDHKFFTSNRGWVCASDLNGEDNIVNL